MKDIIAALYCIASMVICAGPAAAQSSRTWSPPEGGYSVTIPEGWDNVSDASADSATLLTIGSAEMRLHQGHLRQCSINHHLISGPGSPLQDRLNEYVASRTAADAGVAVNTFTNEMRDGVEVIALETNAGDTLHMQTMFVLARTSAADQVSIACGAEGPNAETDIAAMHQFMNSLSFLH